jgi:phosphoribosylformylglycinamidine (FGAM) synthase-like amidotransferase family enzyme
MSSGADERPTIAVVVFPGSNDNRDAQHALELLGAAAPSVWHTEERLPDDVAGVVLPGGFSYGDYLRCGAIDDVAGVVNLDGNVFGLMPHPEHAVDPLLGSPDGGLLLGALVDAARLSTALVV